ncbi:hypothetical protein HK096_006628, partial [Nowakowskiella sp. JEL0078]
LFAMLSLNRLLTVSSQDLWIQKWVSCLFKEQAIFAKQPNYSLPFDTCHYLISDEVPSLALSVFVNVVRATPGIWLFIIFGLRGDLARDWISFLRKFTHSKKKDFKHNLICKKVKK